MAKRIPYLLDDSLQFVAAELAAQINENPVKKFIIYFLLTNLIRDIN